MMGVLKLVAKKSPFQPDREKLYKNLCERIYLSQSSKKEIKLTYFKLYKQMLIHRPRLRTNGFYCLRTMYSKARCQDNFWEEKNFESIEVNYYRYFRFYDNGIFLYCMDVKDPDEVSNALDNGISDNSRLKIFRGTYSLQGRLIVVEVDVKYTILSFDLQLCNGSEGDDLGYAGHHNLLRMIQHVSISTINGRLNRHKFALPYNVDIRYFRRWKYRNLPKN